MVKTRRSVPELLAPARDAACVRAALDAGADAVYFGSDGCNMRAARSAIPCDQVPSMVASCHDAGARAYLTLNAMVLPQEQDMVDEMVALAVAAGIDAVIASDPAVILAARDVGMEVVLSTQMSTANARSIRFWQEHAGVSRVVLARECSLADIAAIRAAVGEDIGLEVFVHGAMCVAVSGRCLISQLMHGCSGNRGQCLQPCRREYRLVDVDHDDQELSIGAGHVLSPRDLCTLPILDRIIAAGADSLKIEGRMRAPEYVATVTEAYRRALDCCLEHAAAADFRQRFEAVVAAEMPRLQAVFNRGFSSGFLFGRPGNGDWADGADNRATHRKELVGPVVNYYRHHTVAEIAVQARPLRVGETVLVQGPTTGSIEMVVDELQIDHHSVSEAGQGSHVALRTSQQVRRNDLVFVVMPVDQQVDTA